MARDDARMTTPNPFLPLEDEVVALRARVKELYVALEAATHRIDALLHECASCCCGSCHPTAAGVDIRTL